MINQRVIARVCSPATGHNKNRDKTIKYYIFLFIPIVYLIVILLLLYS